MSNLYYDLQDLAVNDPSEALYRAEEELEFDEFMAFVVWIGNSQV